MKDCKYIRNKVLSPISFALARVTEELSYPLRHKVEIGCEPSTDTVSHLNAIVGVSIHNHLTDMH